MKFYSSKGKADNEKLLNSIRQYGGEKVPEPSTTHKEEPLNFDEMNNFRVARQIVYDFTTEFKNYSPRQAGLVQECRVGDPELVEFVDDGQNQHEKALMNNIAKDLTVGSNGEIVSRVKGRREGDSRSSSEGGAEGESQSVAEDDLTHTEFSGPNKRSYSSDPPGNEHSEDVAFNNRMNNDSSTPNN